MWTATNWNRPDGYELIDAGGGERLERFGPYTMVRPDPQVIWHTDKRGLWEHPDAIYHRSDRGGGEWEIRNLPDEWTVRYGKLSFVLHPFSFKHTGLFPEQAANWDWMSDIIAKAAKPRPRILNLFAYTGGASLAAAAAGAAVTHVDASKGAVTYAKQNAAISGLDDAPIRYLVDDCVKFMKRELRRGNRYDAVIMDPPSYGRGPSGEVWKLESGLEELVTLAAALLSDRPLFMLINAYTTGLQPEILTCLVRLIFNQEGTNIVDKKNQPDCDILTERSKSNKVMRRNASLTGLVGQQTEAVNADQCSQSLIYNRDIKPVSITTDALGLPISLTGMVLPCGNACRVVF